MECTVRTSTTGPVNQISALLELQKLNFDEAAVNASSLVRS